MSDHYFAKYYQAVKDPSWPEITDYTQFLHLPEKIKKECKEIHGLDLRLQELANQDHWRRQSSQNVVYVYQNVAYLPLPKCASTYYKNFFHTTLGWQKQYLYDIDLKKIKCFGLIKNPMVRRLKGIVESLYQHYMGSQDLMMLMQNKQFVEFVSSIMVIDIHSAPYTMILEPYLDAIHWIPMDLFSDSALKTEIQRFLAQHDVHISMPDHARINQSARKEMLYKMLSENFLKREQPSELQLLFAKDVQFYNKLIENYAYL